MTTVDKALLWLIALACGLFWCGVWRLCVG